MTNTLRAWPLVFTYRGRVQGNGFTAVVDAVSRILAEEQVGNRIWMSGAQPGGFAAGGEGLDGAYAALKEMFRNMLLDTAEEAADFTTFRDELDRFFKDPDHLVAKQWQDVWTANRRGELDCGPADRLLRVKGDEQLPTVEITEVPVATEQPQQPRTESIPSDIARLAA